MAENNAKIDHVSYVQNCEVLILFVFVNVVMDSMLRSSFLTHKNQPQNTN